MTQETRKIILESDELVAALEAHRKATPDFLPGGAITSCKAGPDFIHVVMVSGDATLKSLDLLKTLIRFCLKHNIPLPRDGKKTYTLENGKPALTITLTIDPNDATHTEIDEAHIEQLPNHAHSEKRV